MIIADKSMACGIAILPAPFGKPFSGAFASETTPVTFIHHKVMPFVKIRAEGIKRDAIHCPLVLLRTQLIVCERFPSTPSACLEFAIRLDLMAIDAFKLLELPFLQGGLVLVTLALLLEHSFKVLAFSAKG